MKINVEMMDAIDSFYNIYSEFYKDVENGIWPYS